MNPMRAFFLTMGIGLMGIALFLLVQRPEPADMRFRDLFGWIMTVGFCAGFLLLLIFSNKWRKPGLAGAGLFGLSCLVFYLGGRLGGQSVGSTGWVIGLILIGTAFPGALILMGISGIASLGAAVQEAGSKAGLAAGLALLALLVGFLTAIMLKSPDMEKRIAALHDPNPGTRMQAIHQLGAIDSVRGKEALIALLHHEDPAMRAAAAEALGHPPPRHLVVIPLTGVLKDADRAVRCNAARSLGAVISGLGRRQYAAATDALREALADDSGEVRAAAAEAAGWIGDPRAVAPLIDLLEAPATRFQAHNALITITGQRLGDDPAAWRNWLEKR